MSLTLIANGWSVFLCLLHFVSRFGPMFLCLLHCVSRFCPVFLCLLHWMSCLGMCSCALTLNVMCQSMFLYLLHCVSRFGPMFLCLLHYVSRFGHVLLCLLHCVPCVGLCSCVSYIECHVSVCVLVSLTLNVMCQSVFLCLLH